MSPPRRLAEDDLSGLPPDAPRRATRWGLAQSEATFAAGDAWVAADEASPAAEAAGLLSGPT